MPVLLPINNIQYFLVNIEGNVVLCMDINNVVILVLNELTLSNVLSCY